jgi:hypothetical protein
MTWLFEERQGAMPVMIIGVLSALILAFGWTKTGRQETLFGLAAVILLCLAVLGLQKFVVTENERVEATLAQIARDVERNDLQAVLAHVHSSAKEIHERVESEFPNYRFSKVKITSIREIKVEPERIPPRAIAKFSVMVVGTDASGFLDGQQPIWRYVVVTFHMENGRWRVQDYEHLSPERAIQQ